MTSTTWADQPTELLERAAAPAKAKRTRVRGLRITALPSWPLLAQAGGGISTLSGVYLQFGLAVTLIVGGISAVVLGTLREGGKI